ncbi:MAG TPA: SIS domain-containing protein [Candidatus Limnocylindrales bacterium]|nr:SIS domain-containing protein [Candidatus Limnocylindrales bacterium]
MSLLWRDTVAMPDAIERTLVARDGVDAVVAELRDARTRRIVASGNGAAWYVSHALWLASLEGVPPTAPLISLPAGALAGGRFRWRAGDVLLAVSTSGELRDLIDVVDVQAGTDGPDRTALITATPNSSLARRATAVATTRLADPAAFTHSQAYVSNVALGLLILAETTADRGLARLVRRTPAAAAEAVQAVEAWSVEADPSNSGSRPDVPRSVTVFGSGPAWAAALEAALLLREVGRLAAEGTETREAATSSMFGLGPADLVVSLPIAGDRWLDEAERTCAGTGARVVRIPGSGRADARLAPILAFPGSVHLSIRFAELQGLDPDAPETATAYYATARRVAPGPGASGAEGDAARSG